MDTARTNITRMLEDSECPAVLSSFGKDSMLLLHLVQEVRSDTSVLWFRTGLDERFARQQIARLMDIGVTVFSYAPADIYLLARGLEHTLVTEYAFGTDMLPLLTDLTEGGECLLTKFPERLPELFQPWDVLLTGYKDSDTHWTVGHTKLFEEGVTLGRAKVYAPIRHMSDDQVRAAIVELNIPYQRVHDELPVCTRCMERGDTDTVWCPDEGRLIPRVSWDQQESLSAFRKRFNMEVN